MDNRENPLNQEEKTRYLLNRNNWNEARPQKLPRTTYWPFFFALGLAFLVWGLVAGAIVSVAGLVAMGIALTGWITELRHESGGAKDERR